ncbi:MAG: methyltransferase domain-containing protein [Acidobacteriota bacterium]
MSSRGTHGASELAVIERRLRTLQDAYYDHEKDDAVILEYLRTLAQARALAVREASAVFASPRLHLGCGDHRLEGWYNADILLGPAVDLLVDAPGGLPFPDDSLAFIHSEDLLEHVDLSGGTAILRECIRTLRPGGVMRVLTPDLRALVDRLYNRREPRHLGWCARHLSAEGPCESLNMHLRMDGEHRFVYDEEHLRALLEKTGFLVRAVRYNESPHPELRYLDLRDFGLNLFLEAVKPERAAV